MTSASIHVSFVGAFFVTYERFMERMTRIELALTAWRAVILTIGRHPQCRLWSWNRDSNPEQVVYKTTALPVELSQQMMLLAVSLGFEPRKRRGAFAPLAGESLEPARAAHQLVSLYSLLKIQVVYHKHDWLT